MKIIKIYDIPKFYNVYEDKGDFCFREVYGFAFCETQDRNSSIKFEEILPLTFESGHITVESSTNFVGTIPKSLYQKYIDVPDKEIIKEFIYY